MHRQRKKRIPYRFLFLYEGFAAKSPPGHARSGNVVDGFMEIKIQKGKRRRRGDEEMKHAAREHLAEAATDKALIPFHGAARGLTSDRSPSACGGCECDQTGFSGI